MRNLKFRTTHETHPGLRRRENEDAVAIHESGHFWAVADGMGGHLHGRFASDTVTRRLSEIVTTGVFAEDVSEVQRAVNAANRIVYDRARMQGVTIGTTLAALYTDGAQAVCFWVGDSRVYRFRDGVLEQLTRDHTQVRHLLDTRQISGEEAKNHPMGHVLTRAIGVDEVVRLDMRAVDVEPDDIFLICSDGLTACAEEFDIVAALREAGGLRACTRLLDLCLERGAPDNVSIISVICDEVTAVEDVPAVAWG
ncbi:MAG: serine/threonine-protein phosphatase [Alphaproteobacteria bacterium]|nr:serine/threonine-protein phosphatase [Alphaproteobacteria bacterium]